MERKPPAARLPRPNVVRPSAAHGPLLALAAAFVVGRPPRIR